jgi:hypothetical protein
MMTAKKGPMENKEETRKQERERDETTNKRIK